jgi:hypothetical protein
MHLLIIGSSNTGKTEYLYKLQQIYYNYGMCNVYDEYFCFPNFKGLEDDDLYITIENNLVGIALQYDAVIIMCDEHTTAAYIQYQLNKIKNSFGNNTPTMVLFNHCDKLEAVKNFINYSIQNPDQYVKCCCAIKDINVDYSMTWFINKITNADL